MIGFWEKDKGCREKEKVARLVDNRLAVVDKCLTTNAPLLTSLTAYHCKDCVYQAFGGFALNESAKGYEQNKFCFSASGGARQGKRARFCLVFLIFVKLQVESFEEFCLC